MSPTNDAVISDSSKSNFSNDSSAEEQLGIFLDDNYYSLQAERFSYKRIKDKALQRKGIDVITRYNNTGYKTRIDEKGQLHYLKSGPLNTFAFELQYLNKDGNATEGWFVSKKFETDAYLLCWPKVRKEAKYDIKDLYKLRASDFTEVDIALVDKDMLKKKVCSFFGKTKETIDEYLISIANEMRKEKKSRLFDYDDQNKKNDMYFVLSSKYVEAPVLLVIRKSFLKKKENGCRFKKTIKPHND